MEEAGGSEFNSQFDFSCVTLGRSTASCLQFVDEDAGVPYLLAKLL